MRRGAVHTKQWVLAIFIAAFFVVSVVGYFLLTQTTNAFRDLEKLDVISYCESAKSFQGGVYVIEGTTEEVLLNKTGRGKLISLAITSSKGVIPIPVLVPETLRNFNLQKGQVIKLKVKSIERGLLEAEKIEKC